MNGFSITKKTVRSVFIGILCIGVIACGSTGDIRSDYDPDADFGSYQTYNFFPDAGPNDGEYQSFWTRHMISAISTEMENRGYTKARDPDLLLNFNGIIQEKTQVRTSPAPPPPMGYYGYRRSYYDPWGSYSMGNQTSVSQYNEGTFNIDIVDAKTNRLVWEAIGVGKVSQKALENLEESVNRGVGRFFEEYPFRAGDPMPVAEN